MTIASFTIAQRLQRIVKTPTFRTTTINYGNKVEQRIANDSLPRYKFQCQFNEHLTDTVMDEIMAFFEARKGSYEAFYLSSLYEAYRPLIWTPATAYVAGNIRRPTTINGKSYRCTVGGTSHSSEPVWPTTVGGTVTDNTVTWKENTYLVRFESDLINAEYVHYNLATYGTINMIEVSA